MYPSASHYPYPYSQLSQFQSSQTTLPVCVTSFAFCACRAEAALKSSSRHLAASGVKGSALVNNWTPPWKENDWIKNRMNWTTTKIVPRIRAGMGWFVKRMASSAPSNVTIPQRSQPPGTDSAKTNHPPPSYQAKRTAFTFPKQQRRVVDAMAHLRSQTMLARQKSRGAGRSTTLMSAAAALIINAAWWRFV